jgi:hypothetical protein
MRATTENHEAIDEAGSFRKKVGAVIEICWIGACAGNPQNSFDLLWDSP